MPSAVKMQETVRTTITAVQAGPTSPGLKRALSHIAAVVARQTLTATGGLGRRRWRAGAGARAGPAAAGTAWAAGAAGAAGMSAVSAGRSAQVRAASAR